MRIISQDGRTDIPYENFVFGATKDNYIIAIRDTIARPSEIAHGIVAKYSTEAKAQKAMEMLRKEYGKHFFGQGGAMATANFYVPPFSFIPPKVFQFPKDEDVEVENET